MIGVGDGLARPADATQRNEDKPNVRVGDGGNRPAYITQMSRWLVWCTAKGRRIWRPYIKIC